jgi:hypothetical protein
MLDFNNADWNFPVEEHPLLVNDKVVEGWKALVNGNTGNPLFVHRNSYHVLKNDDVVNATYDAVKASNLSSDFDFKVTSLEDGRKLKVEVLFNDVVSEPSVGDYVKFRVTAFNSYDGAWSYTNQADGLRLFCLNGCTTTNMISRINARHTTNLSIEGTSKHIINGLQVFHDQRDVWQSYIKSPVSFQIAERFFKDKLVQVPTKTSEEKFNSKQLETLLGIYYNEQATLGANKWALYNAMTYWATHTGGTKSPHNLTRQREQAIAFAMNTKAWAEI